MFKVYTSDDHNTTNDGIVTQGSLVTFTITVTNQGNQPAANVAITDYMPAGFSFPAGNATNTANGWSLVSGNPTTTIASLTEDGTAGDTVTRDLVLQVTNTATAGTSINYAEISTDDGNDVDSTPNTTNGDDPGGQSGSAADDHIDGNGTGTPGDGVAATDEDDHDPAEVTVEIYDLALRKVYSSDTHTLPNDGVVTLGSQVTFQVTVINQGSLPAADIEVVDYVPAGFSFPAANATNTANGWSLVAGVPTTTIASLDASGGANDTVTREIVLTVTNTATAATHTNYAEISVDDGDDIDSSPDTTQSDPGGQPGSPADDHVDGNGTGTVGDGVARDRRRRPRSGAGDSRDLRSGVV